MVRQPDPNQGSLFIFAGADYILLQLARKRCSRCKEVKPLNEFYVSRTPREGGWNPICIECDYAKKQTPSYREFERTRWHARVERNPTYPLVKEANKRIKDFEQLKREYDYVP